MGPSMAQVLRLASARSGVVTARELVDLGADPSWISRQVRSGRWQRLHRGVLVTHSGPLLWPTRAWGAVHYAGAGAALSHEAAAHRHGFGPAPRLITVGVPRERRVMPTAGLVIQHRIMPLVGGRIPTVWRGDTVVDLAAAAGSVDDALGWICRAMREGCETREVAEALAVRGRVRNRRLLRDLIADADAGIESPLEARYHRVELAHGLPRAILQERRVVAGRWIRADRLHPAYLLVIELDGDLAHRGGRTDQDTWRDNAVLLETGRTTLRYRWSHVIGRPCAVAGQVSTALRARGWQGTPRPCAPTCAVGPTSPLRLDGAM